MKISKGLIIGCITMFVLLGAIVFLPYLFVNSKFFTGTFSTTGQIGDSIGGIAGPAIAFIASILTFLAFYVQYQANIQQREQFETSLKLQKEQFETSLELQKTQFEMSAKLQSYYAEQAAQQQSEEFASTSTAQKNESIKQQKKAELDHIENRFFELLKIHQLNVNDVRVSEEIRGRKSFEFMFEELRWIYFRVESNKKQFRSQEEEVQNEVKEISVMDFSYLLFFYGIGRVASYQYLFKFNKGELALYKQVASQVGIARESYYAFKSENPNAKTFEKDAPLGDNLQDDKFTGVFSYAPLLGHANQIGHLYRHLYQTCKYILNQDLLSFEQKKEYIKTLRAQLSNLEQVMLYYNALVWFGNDWHELFTDFKFIHNLPLDIMDIGIHPLKNYANEIATMWAERKEMMFEHQPDFDDTTWQAT